VPSVQSTQGLTAHLEWRHLLRTLAPLLEEAFKMLLKRGTDPNLMFRCGHSVVWSQDPVLQLPVCAKDVFC